jgi:hypothetical protein
MDDHLIDVLLGIDGKKTMHAELQRRALQYSLQTMRF